MAPGLSQLRVYIGPTSFGTGADGYIFSQMATDNVANQLSNSWWWSPDDPATDDPYFKEMATQGQTFFSISGDYGAYTGNDGDDMGYPAEDVHLTIVGGTALTTSSPGGPWQSEVVWNDYGDGSGGGAADDGTKYFAIPSWQTPVINSSNGGSTTLRNSPDVALQADFDNYICYEGGLCATNWGGTSFATPRWAAWFALVNQQVVANGQKAGLGFINPTLNSIGQRANDDSDFHDITSGNNDTNGESSSTIRWLVMTSRPMGEDERAAADGRSGWNCGAELQPLRFAERGHHRERRSQWHEHHHDHSGGRIFRQCDVGCLRVAEGRNGFFTRTRLVRPAS